MPAREVAGLTVPSTLPGAVARFGRVLRAAGVPTTLADVLDAVRALEALDLADRDEVRTGLGTVFVHRREDLAVFERCFDGFWRVSGAGAAGLPGLVAVDREAAGPLPSLGPVGQRRETLGLEAWGGEEDAADGEPLEVPGASEAEALAARDFATFGAEQLDELLAATLVIARRIARELRRRRRPSARRGTVDLRRTLRAGAGRGEWLELRFRRRPRHKVRLVVLCDVSGSMDLYSRFLLQFLFALQQVFRRVETFTFATRLSRVTELFRGRSYRRALARLGDVRDWSGGTRIGECLAEFNRDWATLLDRRTIVILLSDGWETGEPERLAAELVALKRRAARLVWLNPLLGNPQYQPLTRGMAAALPVLDVFASAHSVAALRELGRHLRL